jgi:hypothetical protein
MLAKLPDIQRGQADMRLSDHDATCVLTCIRLQRIALVLEAFAVWLQAGARECVP